jgi:hypothetical protein
MSFDFPSSPATGTLFQPAGGPTYRWSGTVWTAVAAQFQGAMPSDAAPSNPVPGQLWWESDTGALFVWFDDGNSQQWVQVVAPPAGKIVQTVVTADGVYTKPAGLKFLEPQAWGGGGAGGGSGATAAGQFTAGAGGYGGAFASSLLAASAIGATETMTIGIGGTGVLGSPGGAGGATTFGGLVSAAGGPGGAPGGANTVVQAVANTTALVQSTAGQIRGWTPIGGHGHASSPSAGNRGGIGGQTILGGAGGHTVAAQANTGCGGSGSAVNQSSSGLAGAAGASGVIILKEYF